MSPIALSSTYKEVQECFLAQLLVFTCVGTYANYTDVPMTDQKSMWATVSCLVVVNINTIFTDKQLLTSSY